MTVDATDNLVFVPAKSSVGTGQVIEFKNTGSVEHTVTFSGSLACLSDDTLDPGGTWDVEFNNPGSVQLHLHDPRPEHGGRDHGDRIGGTARDLRLCVAFGVGRSRRDTEPLADRDTAA